MHPFGTWLHLLWSILTHWLPRYLLSWAVLLGLAGGVTYECYTWADTDDHEFGTTGHTTVDFGGQWYLGRLLLDGQGRHIYERHHTWVVIRKHWPASPFPEYGLEVDRRWIRDWRKNQLKNNKGKDWVPNLFMSYLRPLGATNGVEAAVLAEANYQAQMHDRAWYGNPYRHTNSEDLMYWLMSVEYDREKEAAPTYGGCTAPLATLDPIGAAAIAVAGKEQVWTEPRMTRASKRLVGGNLYPPIHAFLYVPYALVEPPVAYKLAVLTATVCALLAGLGLARATDGALWWPVASTLVIAFPNFRHAQGLGHNGAIIVAILAWGYHFLRHDADLRGGIIWGLMAYKPSWAVTFFLMLVVTRRWKAALGMGACAVVQILLTLPFVGVQSWLEWPQVIGQASEGYGMWRNWVDTSVDLLSYVRRMWTDFSQPEKQRDLFETRLMGYVLIGVALEVTVRLASMRGRRAKRWSYATTAFLMLGFWMTTFHITYYDTIFATVPVAVLLLTPAHVLVPYFFRRDALSWTATGVAEGQTLALAPRNYGLACNPLIVYVLPLLVWNAWTKEFFDDLGQWYGTVAQALRLRGGWTFQDVVAALPQGWDWVPWLDQPLVVPWFAVLWLWAGWLWLREKSEPEA
jgi:hypothetical protein